MDSDGSCDTRFNSRTPKGCDQALCVDSTQSYCFNARTPKGCDI